MRDREWSDVPGTDARVHPFTRRPDITSSNTYVIDADRVIVIDPGADRDQLDEVVSLVLSIRDGRDVDVLMTHCHLDHCLLCAEALERMPGAVAYAMPPGAAAMRDGDGTLTQAEVMAIPFPRTEVRDLVDRDGVEVLPAPGHSPDSVCYRIGGALFTGDLQFAADPGIAGLRGWSREELIDTADRAAPWFESSVWCCPGHGRCVESSKATVALMRMRAKAVEMGSVRTIDRMKAIEDFHHAEDMLVEANERFSIIAGRLLYLSYLLEELEESDAAERYLMMMESERIDSLLESFNLFTEEYRRGEKIELQVTLKAVQTMSRIESLFSGSGLEGVMGQSLVRRTRDLLDDFIDSVRGVPLRFDGEGVSLCDLVHDIVSNLRVPPCSDEQLLDALDDPDAYLDALASRIVHLDVFEDVGIEVSCDDVDVHADRRRLTDVIVGALEDLVGLGSRTVSLTVVEDDDGVALSIEGDGPEPDEQAMRSIRRRVTLAGGTPMDGVRMTLPRTANV